MKLYHFILAVIISCIFISCNLHGDSEATPALNLKALHVVGNDSTELKFYNGNVMDTIYVGDTITFLTVVYNQFNNLLEYRITSSREKSVEFIWSDKNSMDSVFTAASDYDKGLFVMDGTFPTLYFPFKYIAKEAENDLKLTFHIVNDASRDYNTTTITIVTPIKEKEEE